MICQTEPACKSAIAVIVIPVLLTYRPDGWSQPPGKKFTLRLSMLSAARLSVNKNRLPADFRRSLTDFYLTGLSRFPFFQAVS